MPGSGTAITKSIRITAANILARSVSVHVCDLAQTQTKLLVSSVIRDLLSTPCPTHSILDRNVNERTVDRANAIGRPVPRYFLA